MKTIIEPFDLEKAKNGATIVTRNGQKVRIASFDVKSNYPVLALIELYGKEDIQSYSLNGFYYLDKHPYGDDLMISEEVFEDGDFIYNESTERISIFDHYVFLSDKTFKVKVFLIGESIYNPDIYFTEKVTSERLATEEEKNKLLDLLEKRGKRYNAEKKCIESISKCPFKRGQAVLVSTNYGGSTYWTITTFIDYRDDLDCPYVTNSGCYKECVDYDSNKNLLDIKNGNMVELVYTIERQ